MTPFTAAPQDPKRRRAVGFLFVLALLASGCATPEPSAFRHPDFKPSSIRRPAVLLRVSLDASGLPGEREGSRLDRSSIPEAIEIALLEALNAEGILPVDVTRSARGAPRGSQQSERTQALERARTLSADVVLVADLSLAQRDVVYCRAGTGAGARAPMPGAPVGRPFVARTTIWMIGGEVVRVADGARLLVEPFDATHRLGDIEPDCERGRIERRLSAQEMIETAIRELLALLLRK